MNGSLEPWWIRHAPWWSDQQLYLRDERLHGEIQYDDNGHRAVWQGNIHASGQLWRLCIVWGPGTPYFPPRFYPVGTCASGHQLADGSMCLAKPQAMDNGWRGVHDLGVWLERAVHWFDTYVTQNLAFPRELWPFRAMELPGPEYRTSAPGPAMLIAIPPHWKHGPPGSIGTFRARIPQTRQGLGAIVSFRDSTAKIRKWEAGEALVTGEYDEVKGLWVAPNAFTDSEALRVSAREWQLAMTQRKSLLNVTWTQLDDASPHLTWFFADYGAQYELGSLDFLVNPAESIRRRGPWPGIFLDDVGLDVRRNLGREEPVIKKIASAQFLLVGLGALGSEVAHLLTQEGAERFLLVDGDIFLPGNATRHRANLSDVGKMKVEAVKQDILRVNPNANVDIEAQWLDDAVPAFQCVDNEPMIALGMTGDEASEQLLGEMCTRFGVPCLHAWLERNGTVLRLIRVLPEADPSLLELSRRHNELPYVPAGGKMMATQCAELVLPGSSTNLHAAANFVARVAMDVALGKQLEPNHWLFAPDGIQDVDPRFDAALRKRYGVAEFWLPRTGTDEG